MGSGTGSGPGPVLPAAAEPSARCRCRFQEAQAYADDNSLLFMETSAKTAMNVNDLFLAIGEAGGGLRGGPSRAVWGRAPGGPTPRRLRGRAGERRGGSGGFFPPGKHGDSRDLPVGVLSTS